MFSRREVIAVAGATTVLAAMPLRAGQVGPEPAKADIAISGLLDTIAEDVVKRAPERATSLGIDTGERAALRAQSSDLSRDAREREALAVQRWVGMLDSVNTALLSPALRIDVEVVRTALATGAEGFAFPHGDVSVGGWRNGPFLVAQNMGSYLDTPKFLDASHKVANRADADAYVARLEGWAVNLDHETARLGEARGDGVIASAIVLDKTLAGLRATMSGDPSGWPVVTALADAKVEGNHAERAATVARDRIVPALARQIAELERHRAATRDVAGVWHLKDGAAYYAWALRAATTTTLSPDAVHARGLEELRELHAEMTPILDSLGYTKGSVGARMTALASDPRYQFPAGDSGRAAILAEIQRHLADIRTRLPRGFIKQARGNVEVTRIAPAEEAGAPGAYGGPGSLDGKIPGRFYINLVEPWRHNRFDLPTLTYHEALPGHVWQGEYSQQLSLIRSLMSFSAFSEGWGLYAEQLANELGVYDDNPAGRLGYLQSMAFRACRLVVDTGLHAKRWTRAQAIEWFATTNGSDRASVTGEVDRYCVWPGQACGYKIGHSEINRLRRSARDRLGERFDLRAFNDAVVGGGGVPLTTLAAGVDAFVKQQSARG